MSLRENTPWTTTEGGSTRITIPAGVRDALGLEAGEEPDEVRFDSEEREVAFRFESE